MPHLLAPLAAATNRNVARQLGLTENHIKVSLHRLRRRYREVLRAQVAEKVETEAEIDEELAALSAATQ